MNPPIPALSAADLDAFDPQNAGKPRRLCPMCGDGKPKDAAHRSLSIEATTGLYKCWRCGVVGKLRDFWQERPQQPRGAQQRARLHRAFDVPQAPDNTPADEKATKGAAWRAQLHSMAPLSGTPADAYLSGRGVACDLAHASGARFSADFYGRPAVVFPLRDRDGALVAAAGRYVDGRDNPKARTAGAKSRGLFATPGAFADALPALILTEAPLDALSLAAVGYPALALCGTSGPAWLHVACGLRRVLLAFDADEAGDGAAATLAGALLPYGARCERLRPEGGKDWNATLQGSGAPALADWLAWRVLCEESERASVQLLRPKPA